MLPGSRSPESREARQNPPARRSPAHNRRRRGRIVRAVSVDEGEDRRVFARGQDSGGARPPIAAARLDNHARARGGGDLRRPVARAAVDDQNLVDSEREELPYQRADRSRLVEAGRRSR